MKDTPLLNTNLQNFTLLRSGKVRDLFEAGEHLLLVATDRISAFDHVLPTPIPGKGRILTAMSIFWFDLLKEVVPNHLVTADMSEVDGISTEEAKLLQGRSMLVRKAEPLPAEFIVRGYLAGSGWKDYQENGTICGIDLPQGMKEAARLDPPILTPSTKAEEGHDENITVKELEKIVSKNTAEQTEKAALEIYSIARDHALSRGLILCDTKFEFGIFDSALMLIDEVLTPDSSRFWPKESYKPGKAQESFDKQFVRDYLIQSGWDRSSSPPPLPPDVVADTSAKYEEALRMLTA